MAFLFVALGGALGAGTRYALGLIPVKPGFPVMTLLINLTGSFLMGFCSALCGRFALSKNARLFLQTGLCGGFTTFSAFSLENIQLLEAGRYGTAALYIGASLALCLLGVWLGQLAGRALCA